jgi:hypothetical protein
MALHCWMLARLERALQIVSQKRYLEIGGIGKKFTAGQPMQGKTILGFTDLFQRRSNCGIA